MTQKKSSELTDQELLAEAKKMKTAAILSALTIGAMIGIVLFSIIKKSTSIFTLIPLFFIYRMFNNLGNNEALKQLLKERNLQ